MVSYENEKHRVESGVLDLGKEISVGLKRKGGPQIAVNLFPPYVVVWAVTDRHSQA